MKKRLLKKELKKQVEKELEEVKKDLSYYADAEYVPSIVFLSLQYALLNLWEKTIRAPESKANYRACEYGIERKPRDVVPYSKFERKFLKEKGLAEFSYCLTHFIV